MGRGDSHANVMNDPGILHTFGVGDWICDVVGNARALGTETLAVGVFDGGGGKFSVEVMDIRCASIELEGVPDCEMNRKLSKKHEKLTI